MALFASDLLGLAESHRDRVHLRLHRLVLHEVRDPELAQDHGVRSEHGGVDILVGLLRAVIDDEVALAVAATRQLDDLVGAPALGCHVYPETLRHLDHAVPAGHHRRAFGRREKADGSPTGNGARSQAYGLHAVEGGLDLT